MDIKDYLNKIEQNSKDNLQSIQEIRKLFEKESIFIDDLELKLDDNNIIVTWNSNKEGEFDFQWYNPELGHDPWEHSFSRWAPNKKPQLENKQHIIGLNPYRDKSKDEHFLFRAIYKDETSDTVQLGVSAEEPAPEPTPEPDPEIKDMIWGWWYWVPGQEKPFQNTIKPFADDIQAALETPYKVIPFIGDGSLNEHSDLKDWKSRFKNKGIPLKNVSSDKVPVVILADEPDSYPVSFLETLITLAKEVINPNLKYTFSFRRTYIDPYENPLPQNTDIIWINMYLQRDKKYPNPYIYVDSEETFVKSFQGTIDKARNLAAPGTKFYVTTQSFSQKSKNFEEHGYKFRQPEDETPLWYARYMSQRDYMLGGLHFVYDTTDSWTGAKDMPKYLENVEKVYKKLMSNQ